MRHRWGNVTFLHWPYDSAVVQRLLPDGLTVETFDGAAWVGLVPFEMTVRPLPPFPETNVRTYVTGPGGRTGVWFLSLDADSLPAVVTARATFGLPYFWARMRAGRRGDVARYASTRHRPGPPAHSRVEVTVGRRYDSADLGTFDHYLTARFALWARTPTGALRTTPAHHAAWGLWRATLNDLDDGLVAAAGLPVPTGDPLVHYSEGVDVLIGTPRR